MRDYDIVERPVPAKEEEFIKDMPISAIIDATTSLSDDALRMTRNLKGHLFGNANTEEVSRNPMCIKDVLEMNVETMEQVCRNLAEIMKDIGI